MNTKKRKLELILFLSILVCSMVVLADDASWTEITTDDSPTFSHHSMTYDSDNQQLVLVGKEYTFGDTYQIWFYDGQSWSNPINITTDGYDPEVTYDKDRKVVVLYTGPETWEYDGNDWINKTNPANLPVDCEDGALLKYDSLRKKTVLVASSDAWGGAPTETWLWDGTTWTQVTGTQPSNAPLGGMAFDEERGEMVVITANNMETWTFNGATWTQKNPVTSPTPGVSCISMAYDSLRKVSVFFGGEGGTWPNNVYPTSTWEWDDSNWRSVTTSTPFSDGNIDYALSYFGPSDGIIMHGGWTDPDWTKRNSMWLYKGEGVTTTSTTTTTTIPEFRQHNLTESVSTNSTNISWRTTRPSTDYLEYGLDTSYGTTVWDYQIGRAHV